jgi:hypothetical protein
LIINALVYYALIAIYDLHPHGAWVLSVVSDHAYVCVSCVGCCLLLVRLPWPACFPCPLLPYRPAVSY